MKLLLILLLCLGMCGCYRTSREVSQFSGDEIICESILWHYKLFPPDMHIVNKRWRSFYLNTPKEKIKDWFEWADEQHKQVKEKYIKHFNNYQKIKKAIK